jgi:transcription initiation factor TFIIA small subunit
LKHETLTNRSVGQAMTDALDEFIRERRIEPQIAIKMLQHFDRVVAEVLNEKVKARTSFKVCAPA